jgi:hypothetical protein
VAIGPLAIGGNDPIYDLPLIELKRDGEVYITFPENVTLTVGEVFRIVRPFGNLEERYLSLGRPRITVAKVKILKVHRGRRAEIKVLRGSIIGGVSAERD